jgi:hypothetical protein
MIRQAGKEMVRCTKPCEGKARQWTADTHRHIHGRPENSPLHWTHADADADADAVKGGFSLVNTVLGIPIPF